MRTAFKLLFLAAISTAVFFISCKEDVVDESCFNQELYDMLDSTDCEFLNQPVCACNNVTYLNPCLALKAGYEVVDSLPCVKQTR